MVVRVQPPVFDVAVSPSSTLAGTSAPSYWVSVAERTMRQSSAQSGKQYELDTVQTGEWPFTLDNRDAALSPVNTSSPYSPNVTEFKPMRWRAQYPATVQLLTGDQATCGDVSNLANGSSPVGIGMGSGYDTTHGQILVIGDAWQGTHVFSCAVPSGVTPGHEVAFAWQWTMHPGKSHAAQMRVRVPTGSVSPTVHASLVWVDGTGTPLSESAGTSTVITAGSTTWVQLTAVGTPPANANGAYVRVTLDSASGAFTMQSDGWQVELASAPSAWVQPSTWYGMFFGGAERWPQLYDLSGTFGQATPTVVDAMAALSAIYPLPAFYSDVLALSPDFFFPLDDPVGSVSMRDLTGKHNPAPLVNSAQGAGSALPGQGGSSAIPAGSFLGAPGPVVTFNNVDNVSNAAYSPGTWIELDSVGIAGPASSGNWTRMMAFRCPSVPSNTATIWAANQPQWQVGGTTVPAGIDVSVIGSNGAGNAGKLSVYAATGTNNSPTIWYSSGSACDGNYHIVFLVSSNGGNTLTLYLDSTPLTVYSSTSPTTPQVPCTSDTVGETVLPGNNQTYQGMQGDVAHIAQWSSVLTSAQITTLGNSWRFAYQGETSGQRYSRILGYAGYLGASSVQVGNTTDMGPATDVDGHTDALTLLNNIVITEAGTHYVRGDGTLVFEDRQNRYDLLFPAYTFGEQTQNGEWPYEGVTFDHDITRVIGQAQITQHSTNQVFVANAPTTLAPNYRPTFQRTINVVNPQECVDAANYFANRYANPQLRVKTLRLHPPAVPGLWPVALALGISSRVRVMRRAPGQPAIQFDGFIESLKWSANWDTWDFFLDLEISPADLHLYWVFSALHTTLKNAATAGTNTITCNPLPDSTSNPAAASFCSGLTLTLEPGTAQAETLTVQSFSATSPGYTSFTVTFTANMAFNHGVNAVVCEPIPSFTTDPTIFDPASVLGTSTILAY